MYFSNGFPAVYDELSTFYPVYYRNVYEMDELLRAYGRLGDKVVENIDMVIDNNFILTADEATITALEEFLWIKKDKDRDLEERRRMVYSFFVGFGKISASKIKDTIAVFTDAPNSVTLSPDEDKGNHYLRIHILDGNVEKAVFDDIAAILIRRLPAHIDVKYFQKFTWGQLSRLKWEKLEQFSWEELEKGIPIMV